MNARACSRNTTESEVRTDIRYLERRLAEMSLAGDCAYENALAYAFVRMLSERRAHLTTLRCRA